MRRPRARRRPSAPPTWAPPRGRASSWPPRWSPSGVSGAARLFPFCGKGTAKAALLVEATRVAVRRGG